jgi:predicted nucleotidyltransferase
VALGGSRAAGRARFDSDWDFGLYYRGSLDTDAVRRLGYPGTVVEPGDWGRLVNGGAWLTVEGVRVDLLYRNLDEVEHWWAEAREGRYVRDHVEGYVAGMTSYVLVGELAVNRVLVGELPRPEFPDALRASAPPNWRGSADFSLNVAQTTAALGDVTATIGLLAKASIAAAQAVLAERGEWALNEKDIVQRAGLPSTGSALASLDAARLVEAVAQMRGVLDSQAK